MTESYGVVLWIPDGDNMFCLENLCVGGYSKKVRPGPFRGKLEPSEYPMKTAMRELYEETYGLIDMRNFATFLQLWYIKSSKSMIEQVMRTRIFHVLIRGDFSGIVDNHDALFRNHNKVSESLGIVISKYENGRHKYPIKYLKSHCAYTIDCTIPIIHLTFDGISYVPTSKNVSVEIPAKMHTSDYETRYKEWLIANRKLYPQDYNAALDCHLSMILKNDYYEFEIFSQ